VGKHLEQSIPEVGTVHCRHNFFFKSKYFDKTSTSGLGAYSATTGMMQTYVSANGSCRSTLQVVESHEARSPSISVVEGPTCFYTITLTVTGSGGSDNSYDSPCHGRGYDCYFDGMSGSETAPVCAHCDQQLIDGSYKLGIEDANECNEGDAEITDSLTCQAAAEAMGFWYKGSSSWFGTPGGCLTFEQYGLQRVYFNEHTGKARKDYQRICYKAPSTTATTSTTSTRTTTSTSGTTAAKKDTGITTPPATVDLTGDLTITTRGTTKQAVSEAVRAALVSILGMTSVEIVSITEEPPTTTPAATTSLRKQYSEEFISEEGGRRLSEKMYLVKWRVTVPQADAERTQRMLQSELNEAVKKQLEAAGATDVTIGIAMPPTIVATTMRPVAGASSGSMRFRFSTLLAMITTSVAILSSSTMG